MCGGGGGHARHVHERCRLQTGQLRRLSSNRRGSLRVRYPQPLIDMLCLPYVEACICMSSYLDPKFSRGVTHTTHAQGFLYSAVPSLLIVPPPYRTCATSMWLECPCAIQPGFVGPVCCGLCPTLTLVFGQICCCMLSHSLPHSRTSP